MPSAFLLLTTYRGGSHLSSDIIIPRETPGETLLPESFSTGFPGFLCSICNITSVFLYVNNFLKYSEFLSTRYTLQYTDHHSLYQK